MVTFYWNLFQSKKIFSNQILLVKLFLHLYILPVFFYYLVLFLAGNETTGRYMFVAVFEKFESSVAFIIT